MILMRLLWRRWCRHHFLKTSKSTRPWASRAVSFSGSGYILLILIHDLIFVCLLSGFSNAYQKFGNTHNPILPLTSSTICISVS
jgi:hypothetical protein